MKLLAVTNNKTVVFSVGHHDFRMADGLMADGGQPGCTDFAGYNRFSHKPIWIELPGVSFGELYNDYQFNQGRRKYGIHKLNEVRVIPVEETPNPESLEHRLEGAVWGTRGVNGDQPLKFIALKDADSDHLRAIIKNCPYASTSIKEVILEILERRAKQS